MVLCYSAHPPRSAGTVACFQHVLSTNLLPLRTLSSDTGPQERTATCASANSSQHPDRRAFLRNVLASVAAIAVNAHLPVQARALCGEPDPYFAHYLDWEEGMAKALDGRGVHYRFVGNKRKEVRAGKFPVLYLGDAGVALAAGETLELLGGTDRRVLLVDLLGVGESQPLGTGEFSLSRDDAIALARDEAFAALSAVGISEQKEDKQQSIHIIASGFGLEVAEALLQKCSNDHDTSKLNLAVASVAAEGWTPVQAEKGKDISFELLQGNRICAVEGANSGNISIVRKLYRPTKSSSPSSMVSAIARIAKRVPTIALRTFGVRALGGSVIGAPLFVDHEFSQAGRIAHLTGTDDVLNTLDDFYQGIEGSRKS